MLLTSSTNPAQSRRDLSVVIGVVHRTVDEIWLVIDDLYAF
jgi:hypothetical protein